MKSGDYKQLKKQIEEQYKQAISLAEKQRVEGLAAIETVWGMLHPRRNSNQPIGSQQVDSTTDSAIDDANSPPVSAIPYGTLIETVKKAIELVPETFTRKHIMMALKTLSTAKFNDASVSNRLKQLATKGVIMEVRKGQGRTPAEFKRPAAVTGEKDIGEKT
jgi:hypothetical protein